VECDEKCKRWASSSRVIPTEASQPVSVIPTDVVARSVTIFVEAKNEQNGGISTAEIPGLRSLDCARKLAPLGMTLEACVAPLGMTLEAWATSSRDDMWGLLNARPAACRNSPHAVR